MLSMLQWGERTRITAGIGFLAALAIALGTGEGLAMALRQSGEVFSLATIVGFLVLSLWLIVTGLGLLRAESPVAATLAQEENS